MRAHTLAGILEDQFKVSAPVLAEAEAAAGETGEGVEDVLIRKKIISETLLLEAMARAYRMSYCPRLDLKDKRFGFTDQVPIHFLKEHLLVPLVPAKGSGLSENPGEKAMMVLWDPTHIQAADDLANILGVTDFQVVLSKKTEIISAINCFYDKKSGSAQQIVRDMEDTAGAIDEFEQISDLLDDTSDTPVIQLVNHIISQSVKALASDIHIEPRQNSLKVRYRIDGILYDLLEPPKWIQSAMITRIKVMAGMDIAEKRLPQDSRIEVRIGNRDIDIRISTIPATYGERVVLRLLDKEATLLELSQFGMGDGQLKQIRELSRISNGMLLMTGPTGSGKTTTLYSMLSEINRPDINIITVEDPVEYKLEGINQIQVNPKIDLTFAKSLRSIVRQDPDVILIGEIRDNETASIAVQSAITGHLVLSTLHTNDSASAVTRLVDIGIEPFLITSAVRAVMAQRLIRVLCEHCKEPFVPDQEMQKHLGPARQQGPVRKIFRAKGCDKCFSTGYRGRTPIFEILLMDADLKRVVLTTSDASRIREAALGQNMVSLRQSGIEKVLKGVTTIEEVLRVTQI